MSRHLLQPGQLIRVTQSVDNLVVRTNLSSHAAVRLSGAVVPVNSLSPGGRYWRVLDDRGDRWELRDDDFDPAPEGAVASFAIARRVVKGRPLAPLPLP